MIEIQEVDPNRLDVYANIPISFMVSSILNVELIQDGMGGILLKEVAIDIPYIKDYDNTPEDRPSKWSTLFDIKNWGFFLAYEELIPVAGAAIAFDTKGVNMLEERADLSVLWDIRVLPEKRRHGIGKALFKKACEWSGIRSCNQMKIETQNINTAACHFYKSMGCKLGMIHRYAYCQDPKIAQEVMLNWYITL